MTEIGADRLGRRRKRKLPAAPVPPARKYTDGQLAKPLPIRFLAPALLIYGVLFLIPSALTMPLSLFNWDGIAAPRDVVGLQNFREVLADPLFRKAFGHNIYFFFALLIFQLTVSLGCAILLNRRPRFLQWYRAAIFLPFMIAQIASGFMWLMIFSPSIGLIDPVLESLKLGSWSQDWLGSPEWAPRVVMLALAWQWNGLATVLFLAGLQNVPRELQEAARIDGASERQVFFDMTLPHLAPAITVTTIILFINAFRVFDLTFILGGQFGAPDGSTLVLSSLVYANAFGATGVGAGASRMGYALAQSVVLTVFLAVGSVVLLRVLGARERRVFKK